MRVTVILLLLAMGACGRGESEPREEEQAQTPAVSAPAARPAATPASMPIPNDPAAVRRLEAMGYTVHREGGDVHAPGVKSCPAMADGPVM